MSGSAGSGAVPLLRRAERRIHVLKRDYGLDRCRDRGEDGLGRWVGWGILTHNLA